MTFPCVKVGTWFLGWGLRVRLWFVRAGGWELCSRSSLGSRKLISGSGFQVLDETSVGLLGPKFGLGDRKHRWVWVENPRWY